MILLKHYSIKCYIFRLIIQSGQVNASVAKTEDGSTTTTSFQYDAFGKRIAKTTGNKTTQSVWLDDEIFFDYIIEGSTTTDCRYSHGPGGYEGCAIGSTIYAAQVNYKGDVVGTMDYRTTEFDPHTYTSFGQTDDDNFVSPYGFSGEYTDVETGHQYLRNRYYDPATSRFTQEDDTFIDGLNLYAYCGNDPVNRIDPSGRCYGYCNVSISQDYPKSDYPKGMFPKSHFTVYELADGQTYRVVSNYCTMAETHKWLYEHRDELGALADPEFYHKYNQYHGYFICYDSSHLEEEPTPGFDTTIPESPGAIYKSPDEAAMAFAIEYNGLSIRLGSEMASTIYREERGGREWFGYFTPTTDYRIDSIIAFADVPQGFNINNIVASIHTHANYNKYFSSEEFSIPEDITIPEGYVNVKYSYLATPSGRLMRYDIGNGNIKDFGRIAQHDPKTRQFLFFPHHCSMCAY